MITLLQWTYYADAKFVVVNLNQIIITIIALQESAMGSDIIWRFMVNETFEIVGSFAN